MANASCANCTLVSNVLTLVGSVTGTVVLGMTITGASVPPGVTIASFGTGSGAAGTYNCSSSSANIPSSEAMVFSLSWIMPTVGNTQAPQATDINLAAGFGLIFAVAIGGGTAGPGAEYQFGAHAAQIYEAQAHTSSIFQSVLSKEGPSVTKMVQTLPQYPEPIAPQLIKAATNPSEVSVFVPPMVNASPQSIDLTIQGFTVKPLLRVSLYVPQQISAVPQDNTQLGSQIFRPVIQAIPSSNIVPRTVLQSPQELSTDLTIQGWVRTIPVAQGWLLSMITAGPQIVDMTLQSQFTSTRPFLSQFQGPTSPTTVISVAQADPTQIAASVFKPPLKVALNKPQVQYTAYPTPSDYTQPQGLIIQPSLPGPAKYVQPAFVQVYEQQYDKNSYPFVFTRPTVFNPPPPFTGFYVQAITAGFYGGRFRTPGDIFLLASSADFSDASIDYQPPSSNTIGFGWMQKVTTQQALDWLQSNNAPYLPPQDPLRRFIY